MTAPAPRATVRGGFVRAAVVVPAVVATLLLPDSGSAVPVFAAAGLAVAVLAPATLGALPLLAVEVLAWTFGYGLHDAPPAWRTALFAVALYLVHTTTTLAATVDVRAAVQLSIVRDRARRAAAPIAAGVLAAVVLAVAGHGAGSVAFDVVAFAAVAAVGVALTWLAVRR